MTYTTHETPITGFDRNGEHEVAGFRIEIRDADGHFAAVVEARYAREGLWGTEPAGVNWAAIGTANVELATTFNAAIARAVELLTPLVGA